MPVSDILRRSPHQRSRSGLASSHVLCSSRRLVGTTHRHGLGVLLGSNASGCIRHDQRPVVVPATVEVPKHGVSPTSGIP
jgi:hypothetical protein